VADDTVIEPVTAQNFRSAVQLLVDAVTGDETDARRQGVASALMDAVDDLAVQRGVSAIGTTVGLADSYGPAQRLYAKRGYVADGRGACVGQRPVPLGASVTVDHDLILWLTKDLTAGQMQAP
jgi:hypothetical protein